MKRNIKNLIIATTTIAPVIALVACGNKNTKFDQVNNEKISFATSFKDDSIQNKALNKIFKIWNETENVKNKKDGYMPIELVSVEETNLENKISNKDKNTLYNLTLSYPSTVAILNKYRMNLDFVNVNNNDVIHPKFLEFNQRIQNVEESTYALPISRSGEVLIIDYPFLKAIIKKMQEKPKISILNKEKLMTKLETENPKLDGNTDLTYIMNKLQFNDNFKIENNIEFDLEKIVTNFTSLLEFSKFLGKAFKTSDDQEGIKAFLGIDSTTNPIYSAVFSESNLDYSNFMLKAKPNKSGIDYNKFWIENAPIKDANSTKSFQKIVEKIIDTANQKGAIYLKENERYSTAFLQNHQMLFALGSTAGYKYSFSKNNTKKTMGENEMVGIQAPGKLSADNKKEAIIVQGQSLIGIHANEAENNATKNFVKWFINKKIEFERNGKKETITPLEFYGLEGGYIVPTKNNIENISYLGNNQFEREFLKSIRVALQKNDSNFHFFEDPIDSLSAGFRTGLDTAIKSAVQRSNETNKAESFEEFMKKFKESLSSTYKS